jgi:hypothetical protein
VPLRPAIVDTAPDPISVHRCLQRHGISRLPDIEGDKPTRQRFNCYPIGFFHIYIAEMQTAEGKLYLLVAIDRSPRPDRWPTLSGGMPWTTLPSTQP